MRFCAPWKAACERAGQAREAPEKGFLASEIFLTSEKAFFPGRVADNARLRSGYLTHHRKPFSP